MIIRYMNQLRFFNYIWTFFWIQVLFLNQIGVNSCEYLQISDHPRFGNVYFQQIPLDSNDLKKYNIQETGRPSYVSIQSDGKYTTKLYLFHVSNPISGEGRWIFTTALSRSSFEEQNMVGYLRSWSILPYFYRSSQDPLTATNWYFLSGTGSSEYEPDPAFTISCFNDIDRTIFIQTAFTMSPRLDGYYVERFLTSSSNNNEDEKKNNEENRKSVYTQIKFMESDRQLYLYRLQEEGGKQNAAKWLIGFQYGVDSAYAYCEDNTEQAITINNDWNVLDHFSWQKEDSMDVLSVLKFTESYEFSPSSQELPDILRQIRSIIPYSDDTLLRTQKRMLSLRNQIYIPRIGLGTGGIYLEESKEVFRRAIETGYRLFDLAREYQNEHIIGDLMKEYQQVIPRNHYFLETKVWPTELGFLPTTNAIINSLHDLKTSYIDLYLLHWPQCDPKIDWMHCETTVDPKGTWRESWFALEKGYSEGRIMSIGFSNANIPILTELAEIATILPHVIQNWSELGNLDYEIRQWCEENEIIYQPYASIRNVRFQSSLVRQQAQVIARNHNVTEYDVNLRFFLQTGASIIPRASQIDHLQNNFQQTLKWTLSEQEMISLGWKLKIDYPLIAEEV